MSGTTCSGSGLKMPTMAEAHGFLRRATSTAFSSDMPSSILTGEWCSRLEFSLASLTLSSAQFA